jgi:hypothetical protein
MVHCSKFDDHGNYRHRTVATHTLHVEPECFNLHEYPDYLDVVDHIFDARNPYLVNKIYEAKALDASLTLLDYELLITFFAWSPAGTIKCTLSVTTQYVKSCFPACINIKRCNEAVATDTVFTDTLAFFTCGIKAAQIFIGRQSLVANIPAPLFQRSPRPIAHVRERLQRINL